MIRITVHSHAGRRLDPPVTAQFGVSGGTIGRADNATLSLADPERRISRTHATVGWRGGRFSIRDSGAGMPVVLNGVPLGNGRESDLEPGDEIVIGQYVLGVEGNDPAADTLPAFAARNARALDPTRPVITGGPSNATPAADPFAEFFAPLPVSGSREPQPVAPQNARAASDLMPDSLRGDLDAAFHLDARVDGAPGDDPFGPGNPLGVAAGTALFAMGTEPIVAMGTDPRPASLDSLFGHDVARGDAGQVSAPDFDPATLRDAFLEGAGVPHLDLPPLVPADMRKIGELLRETLAGTLDLLAARAVTKRELRVAMTRLEPHGNNPLKFASSVEAALEHLLKPPGGAFLEPVEAVRDACDGLRLHQLASIAGMRAAIGQVLAKFDPVTMEGRREASGGLAGIVPTARKARLWDLFVEHYAQVTDDVADDLHGALGAAFVIAYDAEVNARAASTDADTADDKR